MTKNERKGFTLIEILIVVAIIAILASVVLVGLGPTQQAGRDARRLSDIREVQNALELFYNKCGFYPGSVSGAGVCAVGQPGTAATWAQLQATLTGANANLGVTSIPQDPSTNRTYGYAYGSGNATYVVGAALENANNSVFGGYQAPGGTAAMTWNADGGIAPAKACSGFPDSSLGGSALTTGATYCVSL
jgi:prepilin-type N-terminal cleavage/methylation domain-containing protein